MPHHAQDNLTAMQAKELAQYLAFAPIAFKAARSLLRLGILAALDEVRKQGSTVAQLAQQTGVSEYGVQVLLDMGMSSHLVTFDGEHYRLAKTGYFLLHDDMSRVNMAFTDDVCYRAMEHLEEAILEGKPAGLRELGDWPTIYPALSSLPEPARTSWFEFDHFYSDRAFPELLKQVFGEHAPQHIVDVGANTGRWTSQCLRHDPQVQMTLVDLPQQLELAVANLQEQGLAERVSLHPANMLEPDVQLPQVGDLWWMSQFLDCFSAVEILHILRAAHAAMPGHAQLYILKLFWDRQQHAAASYSLNATSLYFTCLANGNSRFYYSEQLLQLAQQAGFTILDTQDDIGLGHTLIRLAKTPSSNA